jgi:TldD protein
MLDSKIAKNVLDHALSLGADFAELFIEKNNAQSLQVLHSKVNNITSGIDFGIGIRLIYGTKVLYGYTNSTEQEELMRITTLLAAKDRRDPIVTSTAFDFMNLTNIHPTTMGLDNDVSIDEKVRFLMSINDSIRSQSDKIVQANISTIQRDQEVLIFNSEGLHASDRRHYCRIVGSAIAQEGNEQANGYDGPGAFTGWELTKQIDPKALGEQVAKQALIKLDAADCPAGKMPVVIDNGFGGVIFHEACGHSLETTAVQKKASVFHDKMGEKIAADCVSAVDDGTIENVWGSINIDDEGMRTQKTQLIKDGKLTSFMVDKVGSMKTGYERTGSGRRQSYKFAPASRMRNTFIEAGDSKLEDMIASIDHGIYAAKMGGGSVSPGTGEFNFAAQECYLIKDGKISTPLKAATLIGQGSEVLKQISMVGDNLDYAAGMCGSVSGAVPTSVGQPALKIDEILVGGKA